MKMMKVAVGFLCLLSTFVNATTTVIFNDCNTTDNAYLDFKAGASNSEKANGTIKKIFPNNDVKQHITLRIPESTDIDEGNKYQIPIIRGIPGAFAPLSYPNLKIKNLEISHLSKLQ